LDLGQKSTDQDEERIGEELSPPESPMKVPEVPNVGAGDF
jgi:hypothetical protein